MTGNPGETVFWLSEFAVDTLVPTMVTVFVLALLAKLVVYLVTDKQSEFMHALETRVHRHLQGWYKDTREQKHGFHALTELLLERTYQQTYTMASPRHRRRRKDPWVYVVNRIFLIEHAARQMVNDTLRQTKYLGRYEQTPDFAKIASYTFKSNKYFNWAWGFIPVSGATRLFAVLPALFIITGILGTFLGITSGLPLLREVDPNDAAAAKVTLARFLDTMTFALTTSIVGILLSILFTLANATLSIRGKQTDAFDRYAQALDLLWHYYRFEPAPEGPETEPVRETDQPELGPQRAASRGAKGHVPTS